MSEDRGKRLEEKERLDAEVARSLSVVKVKEAHKQIGDIEKLRKKQSIKSIIERLNYNLKSSKAIVSALIKMRNKTPQKKLDFELTSRSSTKKYVDLIVSTFESIIFDLEKTIGLNKQDFDRLFPKLELNFDTYNSVISNLNCLNHRMTDLKNYCLRLL